MPWRLRLENEDGFNFSVGAAAATAEDWLILGGDFTKINGQPREGVAALTIPDSILARWHPASEFGGFETTFLPAGDTLYVFGYNDAQLAAFTPSKAQTATSRSSGP